MEDEGSMGGKFHQKRGRDFGKISSGTEKI